MDKRFDFQKIEPKIYKRWEDCEYFNPDKLPGERSKTFTIVMPPPNITGSLHIGHALNSSVQDAIIRRKRMQGYRALWLPGFDHAGIATQSVIEKKLIKEKGISRHDLGREKFIEKIWEWKDEYQTIITNQLKKIGASCDWSRVRFTLDEDYSRSVKEAFDYYFGQAKTYWNNKNRYQQGMLALALHRYKELKVPADIVKSLTENALTSEEMGMYWKDNSGGYYWYQAPIETQALLIEVYDEVAQDTKKVDELKIWLLKQKQTQDWKTTKATAEAVYALILRGTDFLASEDLVEITVGNMVVDPKKLDDVKVEAGTGYFKTSWSGGDVKPEMGNIKVKKNDEGVAWGAVYWQYFEQLDKITPAETPLKLNKKVFVEESTPAGIVIRPVEEGATLKVGDKVKIRIELRVDRDMEYVHMKDMRASGFEPVNVISQYKYQDGLGYYESTRDAATHFFISYLRKGTYVFEYPLFVTHKGDFSNGITTIQCMYAPEFTSHSEGIRVKVK